MIMYILIGIAAVLFIAGVVCIFKGVAVEEELAVPISSLEEIEALTGMLSPVSVPELSEEEKRMRKDIKSGAESLGEGVSEEGQAEGSDDKVSFPEGLHEETAGEETPPHLRQDEVLLEESDKVKASESSVDVDSSNVELMHLKGENQTLYQDIEEQNNKYSQLEADFETLKAEYEQLRGEGSEEPAVDPALVADLTSQNEMLTRQIDEVKSSVDQDKVKMEQIAAEKEALQSEVKKREDQIIELQEELKSFQAMADDKVAEAQEMIEKLKIDQPVVGKAELDDMQNKLSEAISGVETLKRENTNLQQLNADLKDGFKKTEEMNEVLLEKEKLMQYELTKKRAQSLGLEKICEDFKVKIESMNASTVKPT